MANRIWYKTIKPILQQIKHAISIKNGKIYLDNFAAEHRDVFYLFLPNNIGDIVIPLSWCKAYRIENKIDRKLCVVIKERYKDVASLYLGKTIDSFITMSDSDAWNVYWYFRHRGSSRYSNLSFGQFDAKSTIWQYNLPPENFFSRFYHEALGLNLESYNPVMISDGRSAKSKKILILPNANSIAEKYDGLFSLIAKALRGLGYQVFINVDPDKPTVIDDTVPIVSRISTLVENIYEYEWVISLRSGMCDLLSLTNASLVVVYPNERMYEESNVQSFTKRPNIYSVVLDSEHELAFFIEEIKEIICRSDV